MDTAFLIVATALITFLLTHWRIRIRRQNERIFARLVLGMTKNGGERLVAKRFASFHDVLVTEEDDALWRAGVIAEGGDPDDWEDMHLPLLFPKV